MKSSITELNTDELSYISGNGLAGCVGAVLGGAFGLCIGVLLFNNMVRNHGINEQIIPLKNGISSIVKNTLTTIYQAPTAQTFLISATLAGGSFGYVVLDSLCG